MSQKKVWLPEIGELTLSKRRGTKSMRLSVSAGGRMRVGMPPWVPYSAGISFALSRKDWLLKHKPTEPIPMLADGDRIGKSFRLRFNYEPAAGRISARIAGNEVIIKSNKAIQHEDARIASFRAAERALKKEAERLLPPRLDELASRSGLVYESSRIRKMTSRWGSCSSHKVITLNFFLMQLPWQMIDYVLVHELVHTKYMDHSTDFWSEFERLYPDAKRARRLMRQYRPVINSVTADVA